MPRVETCPAAKENVNTGPIRYGKERLKSVQEFSLSNTNTFYLGNLDMLKVLQYAIKLSSHINRDALK